MTFKEVLQQVIDWLEQDGRLSYRALKRQFDVDDEYLEDLKEELIYSKRLAVDEDGRVLVWTGGAETISVSEPLSPAPDAQEGPRTSTATESAAPAPEAERRQLTVMFCDLVGSTQLSAQLDPEDLREVVQTYQQTATAAITRYDGYIAQYLGDGLLVYFGYPRAHEDDAQRAVRASLDLLDALGPLNIQLAQTQRVQLAVRIGIHTGQVVVGHIGGGERQEPLALGETPNIAARLEGLAATNQILMSASTRRLVGQAFALEDLGLHTLRGVADPLQVYGIAGELVGERRVEVSTLTLTPLVGREEEIGLLLRRWNQAKAGEGQVVLLSGEPGIGKSRTLQAMVERIAHEPHLLMRFQCSPYHTNTAFYPITEQFAVAAGFTRHASAAEKLERLEAHLEQVGLAVPEVAPLFAAALSIPTGDRYALVNMTPEQQKSRTIAALADRLLAAARQQPLLFIAEDLHWSDPTSLETIGRIIEMIQDARILMICTHRPEFVSPWGPHGLIITLSLNRLNRSQSAALAMELTAGKVLPTEVFEQILAKSDGIPLFVEEVTKCLLESGWLRDQGDHYSLVGPLLPMAIPSTLQDALMARLDRLDTLKEVAQIGATIGREFSYELLRPVAPLDESVLQSGLQQLVKAELCYQRGTLPEATYLFKHALIQDAAYHSLLRSTRQRYHHQIAEILVAAFPHTVATQPELVAHHYAEAGLSEQALRYWNQAAQRAIERSAYVEALSHLTMGLEVLSSLPDTPERTQQELTLRLAHGRVLMSTKGQGAPEVEETYARARALCQEAASTRQLFPSLAGLCGFYVMRGALRTARELGDQLLSLAEQEHDPSLFFQAHQALGGVLMHTGEVPTALTHWEQALALYDSLPDPSQGVSGSDARVVCLSHMAWCLWLLGYPTRARQRIHAALALAEALAHPFTLVYALNFAAYLDQLCREAQIARERSETTIELTADLGAPDFLAAAVIVRGWALTMQGQGEHGIVQMREGLAAYQATRAELHMTTLLDIIAEAYRHLGQAMEGLAALEEALVFVDKNGERFCEPELYRLKGELLLALSADGHAQAETCFQRALDLARRQQSKSWELRAAISLSRLWQQTGKRADAYQLLADTYGWFSEGFDTGDLQEAQALLGELG